MQPFFSIVIPTYNRAHLLKKTIDSVLRQEFKEFELWIVDDGSTDDTEAVVKNLISQSSANIHYLKQPNSERAAARNNGLKASTGDYVLFFDSDDTLYPNHLSVAHAFILEHQQPEFIHLRYDIRNGNDVVVKEGPVFKASPARRLIHGNFLSCNGIFLRRDIALLHPFNEDRRLSAMEDWELWLRLCARYPLHYVNTITSSIINHDERSVVTTKKEALVSRVECLIKYVTADTVVVEYYRHHIRSFKSSCYSYVALHLALTGLYKKDTLRFLIRSIRQSPAFIFHRRFFAIVRRLA